MTRAVLAFVWLAACGASPSRQPVPILNHGGEADTRPGTIAGLVTDAKSGDPLAGVTVIVVRHHEDADDDTAVISDSAGRWQRRDLAAGGYTVTLYYADSTIVLEDVPVQPAQTTHADYKLDQSRADGEVLRVPWHND